MNSPENPRVVRRRLLKGLKKTIRTCGDTIFAAAHFAKYKPGLRPIDVEPFRLRRAGAIRAMQCVLENRRIDEQASRLLAIAAEEAELFKFLCNTCEEPMLYVDKYLVCPRGHGRLIPIEREFRNGPEFRARRIEQRKPREIPRGFLFSLPE